MNRNRPFVVRLGRLEIECEDIAAVDAIVARYGDRPRTDVSGLQCPFVGEFEGHEERHENRAGGTDANLGIASNEPKPSPR